MYRVNQKKHPPKFLLYNSTSIWDIYMKFYRFVAQPNLHKAAVLYWNRLSSAKDMKHFMRQVWNTKWTHSENMTSWNYCNYFHLLCGPEKGRFDELH